MSRGESMEANVIKDYATTYATADKKSRLKQKYFSWRFAAKVLGNIFTYVLLLGIAFVILYPLIRRVSNAFKEAEDFLDSSVVYIPKNPTFDVIKKALYDVMDIKGAGLRTFLLALYVGIAQTAITTLVGYGFARFKFRGSNVLFFCVILTLIVPPQTIFIPLYLRFRFFDIFGIIKAIKGTPLNLINTYWCQLLLALTGLGWKNGLYIYMMKSYFRGVPKELEEAAYVDGARTFKTFVRVMIPAAVPMMVTVFLFSFSWQWTDTFYTTSFYTDKVSTLMPAKIQGFGYSFNFIMQHNLRNTATLLMILPLIPLYIATQKFFVEGIERSGLTGM
jgi:multiple sugar transport system permease protein